MKRSNLILGSSTIKWTQLQNIKVRAMASFICPTGIFLASHIDFVCPQRIRVNYLCCAHGPSAILQACRRTPPRSQKISVTGKAGNGKRDGNGNGKGNDTYCLFHFASNHQTEASDSVVGRSGQHSINM